MPAMLADCREMMRRFGVSPTCKAGSVSENGTLTAHLRALPRYFGAMIMLIVHSIMLPSACSIRKAIFKAR
jgi:hypothetical protein